MMIQAVGTHAPAQDVEAFGHGVEGPGRRAEGDAQAHHAAGAVRVLQRELVRRHGAEVLGDQERLHAQIEEEANTDSYGHGQSLLDQILSARSVSESYLGDGVGVEDGEHVGDEVLPGGLLVLRRLVREAVPAAVRRDGAVPRRGHGQHLVAPRVPNLREAVQEHHRPQLACSQPRNQEQIAAMVNLLRWERW